MKEVQLNGSQLFLIKLLGDTARRDLQLEGFEELNRLRVKKDCGKTLTIGGYRTVLYVYPSIRNSHIFREHPLAQLLKS